MLRAEKLTEVNHGDGSGLRRWNHGLGLSGWLSRAHVSCLRLGRRKHGLAPGDLLSILLVSELMFWVAEYMFRANRLAEQHHAEVFNAWTDA